MVSKANGMQVVSSFGTFRSSRERERARQSHHKDEKSKELDSKEHFFRRLELDLTLSERRMELKHLILLQYSIQGRITFLKEKYLKIYL